MTSSPSERLTKAEKFWNESARWNVARAIFDSEEVRDPERSAEAFDQAGLADAEVLAHYITPDMRVVDLGCGIGRVMRPLAALSREVIGIDISEEMLERGREYLAGTQNARLVHTSGAELPGIEDGSVGFLYSLLCLIHVDKRSAYRYLREIARALEPGGMAFLQFENILSPDGLQEFQRVVDLEHEYPLELYSLPELEVLFRSVGLSVLQTHTYDEFLTVTVLKGSVDEYVERVARGVRIEPGEATGIFAADSARLATGGKLTGNIRCELERPLTFMAEVGIWTEEADGEDIRWLTQSMVTLEPGRTHRVEVDYPGGFEPPVVRIDDQAGRYTKFRRSDSTGPGQGFLAYSLLPPGFSGGKSFQARFPGLTTGRRIRIEAE